MAFTYDSSSVNLSQMATTIVVARYDDKSGDITPLPNVVCDRVEWPIGAKPSTASLRYLLDTSGIFPKWPSQYEQIWPQTAAAGPYVLSADDRVIVVAYAADGTKELLFDGYAQIPQVNLDGNSQQITVTATGAECRCWDTPITGRCQRDYRAWYGISGDYDFYVDLPARMNPSHGRDGIVPNCTKTGYDTHEGEDAQYPVFLDEHVRFKPTSPDDPVDTTSTPSSPDRREFWTADKAIRYLLYYANKTDPKIGVPAADDITRLLSVREMSISDDGTSLEWGTTKKPLAPLRDIDVTNKAWPEAAEMILRTVGFGCYFDCAFNEQDIPHTYFHVYKINDWDIAKTVTHAAYGSDLDPAKNNVAGLAITRDLNQIVNTWGIETHPNKFEISVVLAPGFTPHAGDETSAKTYYRSNLTTASATTRNKYRRYIADTLGVGHYDGTNWITTPLDLSTLFPNDSTTDKRTYVHRVRRGVMTLLSKDDNGKPRQACVHWSTDYLPEGALATLWDGTGTWKTLAPGEWRLLDDELGVVLICENPEKISTGAGKAPLKGISSLTTEAGTPFALMLTTVVDADFGLSATVPPRVSSPTKYKRFRRHDARDHYQKWVATYPSIYNDPEGPPAPGSSGWLVLRDDTKQALQLATEYRSAHEMPPLAGSVTIPGYTTYYRLGERIMKIEGRECWLRANTSPSQTDNEQPMYPMVVKVAWNFQGDQQTTTIHLSDMRAEPRG